MSLLVSIAQHAASYFRWESLGLFQSNSRAWFVLTAVEGAAVMLIPYVLVAAIAKEMKYTASQIAIGLILFVADIAGRRKVYLERQSSTSAVFLFLAYGLVIGVALPVAWGVDRLVWRARSGPT